MAAANFKVLSFFCIAEGRRRLPPFRDENRAMLVAAAASVPFSPSVRPSVRLLNGPNCSPRCGTAFTREDDTMKKKSRGGAALREGTKPPRSTGWPHRIRHLKWKKSNFQTSKVPCQLAVIGCCLFSSVSAALNPESHPVLYS